MSSEGILADAGKRRCSLIQLLPLNAGRMSGLYVGRPVVLNERGTKNASTGKKKYGQDGRVVERVQILVSDDMGLLRIAFTSLHESP